jgi:hypothetical protein
LLGVKRAYVLMKQSAKHSTSPKDTQAGPLIACFCSSVMSPTILQARSSIVVIS